MQELSSDPEIFMRSLASRGALGGLSAATLDVIALLDAFGKDVILIETVGAGQDEVEIAGTAQTTILVNMPGTGDDIQTMKAGIMEIADVLAVNKADLPGADLLVSQLRAPAVAPAQPRLGAAYRQAHRDRERGHRRPGQRLRRPLGVPHD